MKSCIIAVNGYQNVKGINHQVKRMQFELESLGVKCDIVDGKYLFNIDNNSQINSNLKCDFCLNLDKDKYFSLALEKLNIKTFNNAKSIELCDDKMLTYLSLLNNGVLVPKTFSSPLCYTSGAIITANEFKPLLKELTFPLVVKLSFSSLGKGVFLVKNVNELVDIANEYKFSPKIYQEYIESSYGKDCRVICVGGKYLCSILRSSKNDFRSNSALGGTATKFDPPKSFIKTAEKVAKILKLDYMGIDILFGKKGEPIVCEVNSNAFFESMEEATGVNVAKAYATHIYNKIYGGKL